MLIVCTTVLQIMSYSLQVHYDVLISVNFSNNIFQSFICHLVLLWWQLRNAGKDLFLACSLTSFADNQQIIGWVMATQRSNEWSHPLMELFVEDLAQHDHVHSIVRWWIKDGIDDHVQPLQFKWPQTRTGNLTEAHMFYHQEIWLIPWKLPLHDLVAQIKGLEKTW